MPSSGAAVTVIKSAKFGMRTIGRSWPQAGFSLFPLLRIVIAVEGSWPPTARAPRVCAGWTDRTRRPRRAGGSSGASREPHARLLHSPEPQKMSLRAFSAPRAAGRPSVARFSPCLASPLPGRAAPTRSRPPTSAAARASNRSFSRISKFSTRRPCAPQGRGTRAILLCLANTHPARASCGGARLRSSRTARASGRRAKPRKRSKVKKRLAPRAALDSTAVNAEERGARPFLPSHIRPTLHRARPQKLHERPRGRWLERYLSRAQENITRRRTACPRPVSSPAAARTASRAPRGVPRRP